MPSVPATITNILSATIKTLDINTGETFITKSNGDPAVNGVVGKYTQRLRLLGPGFDTPLPVTNGGAATNGGDQLYIKNTDPNAKVTIKWQKVSGGGTVSAIVLPPGGMIILWNPIVGSGVNSVSAASDLGGTYIEVFQGVIDE